LSGNEPNKASNRDEGSTTREADMGLPTRVTLPSFGQYEHAEDRSQKSSHTGDVVKQSRSGLSAAAEVTWQQPIGDGAGQTKECDQGRTQVGRPKPACQRPRKSDHEDTEQYEVEVLEERVLGTLPSKFTDLLADMAVVVVYDSTNDDQHDEQDRSDHSTDRRQPDNSVACREFLFARLHRPSISIDTTLLNLDHSISYDDDVPTSRPYRSQLRSDRAEETRLRIRRSARTLFAANGFVETTINQIADDAGVAQQTVYAVFGSKGGIVAAMLEDLEESTGLNAWVARMIAEEDPHRQLRIFVSWICTFFHEGAPMLRAALQALDDPDVAAFAERGDANRRSGTRQLTAMWDAGGFLREGVEAEAAAQRLWLLTNVEQYLHAVDQLGWETGQYEQWLGDLLEREILQAR